MSREPMLVVLGAMVIIAPFSGLPLSWLMFLLPLIGALILLIGVSLTLRKKSTVVPPYADTPIDHA